MARARTDDFKSPKVRFSFLNIFKPRKNDKGVEIYDCTLLMPKATTDLRLLIEAIKSVAVQEWGDKGLIMLQQQVIRNPILDGDGVQAVNKQTMQRYPGFEGNWFIRCGSQRQPPVVTGALLPATAKELYSGAYGFAAIHCFAWEHPTNGKGISFGLSSIQVTEPGERLGGSGGVDPEKFFDKVVGSDPAAVAAAAGAGAGGFFGNAPPVNPQVGQWTPPGLAPMQQPQQPQGGPHAPLPFGSQPSWQGQQPQPGPQGGPPRGGMFS